MTATAPAFSAISACLALVTSMMTPPLSISARPVFRRRLVEWPLFCDMFKSFLNSQICSGLRPAWSSSAAASRTSRLCPSGTSVKPKRSYSRIALLRNGVVVKNRRQHLLLLAKSQLHVTTIRPSRVLGQTGQRRCRGHTGCPPSGELLTLFRRSGRSERDPHWPFVDPLADLLRIQHGRRKACCRVQRLKFHERLVEDLGDCGRIRSNRLPDTDAVFHDVSCSIAVPNGRL